MRMWEIREGYGRKDEVEEAYWEGYEAGCEEAYEKMGHRGGSGGYGPRGGYGQRGSYGMREDDDDMMGERRGVRGSGRGRRY